MAMELKAERRHETQRSATNKLRKAGKIPAVLYGSDIQSQPLAVTEKDLIQVVRQQGINHIISLNVNGNSYNVLIKEVQQEPLKGQILHLDFNQVNMNEEIETMVHIVVQGEAAGVKAGGVLQQTLRELSIACLPGAIPDAITVSVDNLAIGDSIVVQDLSIPSGVTVNHEPEEMVLSVVPADTTPVPEDSEEMEDAKQDESKDTNAEDNQ
ncbi:50S ribosomal protein L25/general stress protein Ctc [Aneurinibacillus sp. Ricciae_BoGa-3]|uniref:50S ribosomal protein L25/general stress protein Ctc n=1 Tax=Aneurinibacillus sp. Ricciae_BoGa-3 TaxID=3022697 RepID=UPI0023415368|nr:50S ribosomal protein L25/general stress protein Ctc [Aneurinibacillus sp. Ricciae_BoGa-3]WCK54629.1 50S ribosomal protein L25/general stress protein Ctc [Aneurinibacillus sp. Ricciae_BoGa-3]